MQLRNEVHHHHSYTKIWSFMKTRIRTTFYGKKEEKYNCSLKRKEKTHIYPSHLVLQEGQLIYVYLQHCLIFIRRISSLMFSKVTGQYQAPPSSPMPGMKSYSIQYSSCMELMYPSSSRECQVHIDIHMFVILYLPKQPSYQELAIRKVSLFFSRVSVHIDIHIVVISF